MKLIASLQWIIAVGMSAALVSCDKNYTTFYEDDDAKDLSVFSDMGNNVMSCYINGHPFRTRDRIYSIGFSSAYLSPEVELFKDDTAPDSDTLTITWEKDAFSPNPYSVSLVLGVKKDFSYDDFTALNNTRLVIDGVSSYFMINGDRSEKAAGSIYFLKAVLRHEDTIVTRNRLSGIFEANAPSYKITRGRFDHTLPIGGREGVVFF